MTKINVIRNDEDTTLWNNILGWVELMVDATFFADVEVGKLRLPMGGHWEIAYVDC